MFLEERHEQILQLLKEHGRVTTKDLAESFQLSIDSIRRDFSILESKGLLKRTHGGAIPARQVSTMPSPDDAQRYGGATPMRNAISQAAVSLLREGDTVFIGGAGIQYGMLPYIPQEMPLTVVTHSLKIADTLRGRSHIQTYLCGGEIKHTGNITDSLAEDFIRQFTLDVCFLSGGAVSAEGVSTATPAAAHFHRTASERAHRVIALSPHENLGAKAFANIIPIEKVDLVITDEEAPEDEIRRIEDRGVKVIVARLDENGSLP